MPTKRYLDIPESEYTDAEAKKKADKEWAACKISHFIVPLYKKIYLEAYVAKNSSKNCFLPNTLNMQITERFI